jgi:beta-mannosidase
MPIHDLGSRPWFLASTSRISVKAALDDPVQLDDWIPATVPGSIQRDLMRAGRLPNLYQALDLDAVLDWVDESDWWYCGTVPHIDPEQRAWLRFSGIDYQAAVTLDGRELGRGPGMYAAREWEVSEQLRGGSAALAVRIWGGGALPQWPDSIRLRFLRWLMPKVQGGIAAFDDRLLTWKAPLHAGWDFAPRLLAVGIWDDVTLHTARSVGILEVHVRTDWGTEHGILAKMTLDSDRHQSVELHARLSPIGFSENDRGHEKRLQLRKGRQTICFYWETAHLRSWNTHDRGFPHLYRLQLQLHDERGLLDEHKTTIGARTIGWGVNKGRNVADILHLNGERLHMRGVNWVPLDLLRGDEAEHERYRHLLQAAVDAGVNVIRVWGGGGRERKVFYDLCDELGLLVWQELPIACVFLDHLPVDGHPPEEDAYLALARREVTGIVRQLRGHPSLAMWCGGNEWGPGRHKRLVQALSQVISQEDPSRRWLPASPGPGDSHNWQVWHDKASPDTISPDFADSVLIPAQLFRALRQITLYSV